VVYWAHHNVSDWQTGSRWELQRIDGTHVADIASTVIESTPPARLVLTGANPTNGTPVAGAGHGPAMGDVARLRSILTHAVGQIAGRPALEPITP
jgi:hypothetical protein